MITNTYEAKAFISSPEGRSLLIARAERDALERHIRFYLEEDSAAWSALDKMIVCAGGYSRLLAFFQGNHNWRACEYVDSLELVCRHVASLELALQHPA